MDDTDATNISKAREQIDALRQIVGELIDLKTGAPLPGVTKEQLRYAIQEITQIKTTYDKRTQAHQEIANEVKQGSWDVAAARANMQRDNQKFGQVWPKWFLKVFGA